MKGRLVVFAKEPRPGLVKTRLGKAIGDEAASLLYAAFLEDLSKTLCDPARWEAVLAYAGVAMGPELTRSFGDGWRRESQGEGSLGDRMARAFSLAAAAGVSRTVLVGSDAPTLTRLDVEAAFDALAKGADVVLAPAPDGGYSLIGLAARVPFAELFASVRWSTASAREDTLARASELGLKATLLGEIPDVDLVGDLFDLARRLEGNPEFAPRTYAALKTAALV